jgi:hypothetical protein
VAQRYHTHHLPTIGAFRQIDSGSITGRVKSGLKARRFSVKCPLCDQFSPFWNDFSPHNVPEPFLDEFFRTLLTNLLGHDNLSPSYQLNSSIPFYPERWRDRPFETAATIRIPKVVPIPAESSGR